MARQNTSVTAKNFTPLNQPIHGMVNGQPVRCIAYGDIEGNSPSYLTVDGQGQSNWQSLSDVQIVDTNFLPLASASSFAGQKTDKQLAGTSR